MCRILYRMLIKHFESESIKTKKVTSIKAKRQRGQSIEHKNMGEQWNLGEMTSKYLKSSFKEMMWNTDVALWCIRHSPSVRPLVQGLGVQAGDVHRDRLVEVFQDLDRCPFGPLLQREENMKWMFGSVMGNVVFLRRHLNIWNTLSPFGIYKKMSSLLA